MGSPASELWVSSTSTASLLATLAEYEKRPHEHVPYRLPETTLPATFILGSGKGYEPVV